MVIDKWHISDEDVDADGNMKDLIDDEGDESSGGSEMDVDGEEEEEETEGEIAQEKSSRCVAFLLELTTTEACVFSPLPAKISAPSRSSNRKRCAFTPSTSRWFEVPACNTNVAWCTPSYMLRALQIPLSVPEDVADIWTQECRQPLGCRGHPSDEAAVSPSLVPFPPLLKLLYSRPAEEKTESKTIKAVGHTSKVNLTMRKDRKDDKPTTEKDQPSREEDGAEPPAKKLVQRARKHVHHNKVRLLNSCISHSHV